MEDELARQCYSHLTSLLGGDLVGDCIYFYKKLQQESYLIVGKQAEYVSTLSECVATVHRITVSSSVMPIDKRASISSLQQQQSERFITIAVLVISCLEAQMLWQELLLERSHEIQVWRRQDENKQWKLYGKATPGNVQQLEFLLESGASDVSLDRDATAALEAWQSPPTVGAILLSSIEENYAESLDGLVQISVAYADTLQGVFGVCAFSDDDVFAHVAALIVQLHMKEVIVLVDSRENRRLCLLRKRLEKSLASWDVRVAQAPPIVEKSEPTIEALNWLICGKEEIILWSCMRFVLIWIYGAMLLPTANLILSFMGFLSICDSTTRP
jgi:hypothetical protein